MDKVKKGKVKEGEDGECTGWRRLEEFTGWSMFRTKNVQDGVCRTGWRMYRMENVQNGVCAG